MVWQRLMFAFAGTELPAAARELIAQRPIAGVTLFRHHNVASAAQVRALTQAIQAAAMPGSGPLLVAVDQEGGQLQALGPDTTGFPGPMALGAAGDGSLAEQVARATARELRALGVNVDYAPTCDLATNPLNPALGVRCFGDDPVAVGRLAAATVHGLQAEGVAATVKHFPGAGEAAADTHHQMAVVGTDRERLVEREMVPFRAALEAGPWLAMAGHFAVPAISGDEGLPASMSRDVLVGLLRDELGFDGLAITDALDMAAFSAGRDIVDAIVGAVAAGQDLLLGTTDAQLLERLAEGLVLAQVRGATDAAAEARVAGRLAALRAWLADFDTPGLSVVGSVEHQALAAEVAARSITLVRDEARLLPLRPDGGQAALVIQSRPRDLTPADTSSTVEPALASALQTRLGRVEELLLPDVPGPPDIAAAAHRARDFDVVVLGTDAAHLRPDQAALADAVLAAGQPTVTIALRTPWDLPAYPQARTHACTYGIQPASMSALAAALVGEVEFAGRLPVEMAPLYPRGHGMAAAGVASR
ncbi:glycoside hydrolase family 3 protein [soil metagenome]